MIDFKLRLIKSFTHILKWNTEHYGRGSHGGEFRSHDSNYDDDDYDKYLAKPKTSKTNTIYREDHKDLVSVFRQFEKDGCVMGGTPTANAKKWEDTLPNVHPHEFLRAFLGNEGVSSKNMGQLQLVINAAEKRISFGSTDDELQVHGCKVENYQRTIDLKNGIASHSNLEVTKASQGGGIVKDLFRACLPLYQKIGINKIKLYANLDRGGYAWGKYGFSYADDKERKSHQHDVSSRLERFTKNVDLTLEAEQEKAGIEKVLRSKKLDSIWHLTDMKTPELDSLLADKIGRDSNKSTFVKLITKDSFWSGEMDITKDSPALARLKDYIKK